MVAIGYRDSGGRECGCHQEVTPDAGKSHWSQSDISIACFSVATLNPNVGL